MINTYNYTSSKPAKITFSRRLSVPINIIIVNCHSTNFLWVLLCVCMQMLYLYPFFFLYILNHIVYVTGFAKRDHFCQSILTWLRKTNVTTYQNQFCIHIELLCVYSNCICFWYVITVVFHKSGHKCFDRSFANQISHSMY